MSNISSILKTEIARVARKESRGEVSGLKSASSRYRSEIAALKRRLDALERSFKQVSRRSAASANASPEPEDEGGIQRRFSAKGLAKHRQRLGLSAADFGKLIGASALSVYKWESGSTHPRAKYLEAIAGVRAMGPQEARARLGHSAESEKVKKKPAPAAAKERPARKASKKPAKSSSTKARAVKKVAQQA
jgi:DNA-binding transcriptional regulator YiaG